MNLRLELSILIGLFIIFFGWHVTARAEAVARAAMGEVTVTLHKEDCKGFPIENLKSRAVWREKGKDVEGCWGASPIGVVMFYFADRTVAAIPVQAFQRVTDS